MPTQSRPPPRDCPMTGASGSSMKQDAEQQRDVAVAREDADVAHDDEREDEHRDPDRDPHRLDARLLAGSRCPAPASRAIMTKPMPFNIAAIGSSVPSAAGANRRTARCATR